MSGRSSDVDWTELLLDTLLEGCDWRRDIFDDRGKREVVSLHDEVVNTSYKDQDVSCISGISKYREDSLTIVDTNGFEVGSSDTG